MEAIFILVCIGLAFWVFAGIAEKLDQANKYVELKSRYGDIENAGRALEVKKAEDARKTADFIALIEKRTAALAELHREKTVGFPWMANAYDEFSKLIDEKYAAEISSKRYGKRAAPSSGEKVREAGKLRRVAEKEARVLRYQILFYENLFPWLTELKDPSIPDELVRIRSGLAVEEDAEVDPARVWIPEGEWNSLSEPKRLQVALDRYWRSRKSKWEIGRDYERYIGFLYEQKGYSVHYHGIVEGLDDLGRDLICKRGDETWIVQCKNWSREKKIHEKHVFQLHGTLIAYRHDNPGERANAHFVTSTLLSTRAQEFASVLGIKVQDAIPFESYPCVKCNVSHKDGTKIFHLPFDQQYDRTTIEINRGEKYCSTIAEATAAGFRRAYRYRGRTN